MATCKLGEKGCWKDGKCHYIHDCKNKVLTNADHIRSMSDEELAKYLFESGYAEGWPSTKDALEWLQQPMEVSE